MVMPLHCGLGVLAKTLLLFFNAIQCAHSDTENAENEMQRLVWKVHQEGRNVVVTL